MKFVARKRDLEGRLELAVAGGESVTSLFDSLAAQLERSADVAHAVAVDAEIETLRIQQVRDEARAQRTALSAKASKIRELFQ